MGNCLGKKTHDPNEPLPEPAHPPTGDDAVRNSNKTSTSSSASRKHTSSGPSRPSKAWPYKEEQFGASQRERNRHDFLNSHKEKHRRNINRRQHGSLTTPKDWPVSKVTKRPGWVPSRNNNSFSYNVLRAATQKFSDDNLIGEGGYGGVYIGYINPHSKNAAKPDTGKAVAIKTLRRRGIQSDEQWQTEMTFLSSLNHPNVVKLEGYCNERNHRILVYEYMCKGSLDAHLLNENDSELNWNRRIKIAIGTARAVDYLHTSVRPVIHRDLKSSNVLLDALWELQLQDFNPKLSDFGLARYGPLDDQSRVITRVLGTKGYFAPEYFTTGRLTVKSDVYSFGVVLLEILSGCVAIKKYSDGMTRDLAIWAKPHLSNQMELHNIIDKKIARNIEMEEAHKFASIIRQCLSSDPEDRPTMGEILANLEQLEQDMLLSNLNTHRLRKYFKKVYIL